MPSHTNPNTPKSFKPRHAAARKAKRLRVSKQRAARSSTSTPASSAAIRKAAPLSNKKARKLEKKMGHARRRALEDEFERREVEMRDVKEPGSARKEGKELDEERMDVDVDVEM